MVAEVRKSVTITIIDEENGSFANVRVGLDATGDIYIAKEGAAGSIYMTASTAKALASVLQGLVSGQS